MLLIKGKGEYQLGVWVIQEGVIKADTSPEKSLQGRTVTIVGSYYIPIIPLLQGGGSPKPYDCWVFIIRLCGS